MFSHIVVGSNDLDASRSFYDAVFAALGIGPGMSGGDDRFFYASEQGLFAVTKPINGAAATFANGGTIGFSAGSPKQVDAWHAAGVSAGGASCEDPPGIRAGGPVGDLYLAYLRDPAGNKLCAFHRMEG